MLCSPRGLCGWPAKPCGAFWLTIGTACDLPKCHLHHCTSLHCLYVVYAHCLITENLAVIKILIQRLQSRLSSLRSIKQLTRRWETQTWHRSILQPLLRLMLPKEGFPWDDLRKILHGGQRMAMVQSGKEILTNISTPWVGRTNVTDSRQMTGGFVIAKTQM